MKTLCNAAMLAGGILLAPLSMTMAQTTNVAHAMSSSPGYVVFLDRDGRLSTTADDTIRKAAAAARSSSTVHVVGREEYAQAVKRELIRSGLSADTIVVERRSDGTLPKTGDGVSDPSGRSVEIRF